MINIFRLFQRPKYISHKQRHILRMKALRADGVRKYYKEHAGMRKVPSYEFGRLTGYIYLPRQKSFVAAGQI